MHTKEIVKKFWQLKACCHGSRAVFNVFTVQKIVGGPGVKYTPRSTSTRLFTNGGFPSCPDAWASQSAGSRGVWKFNLKRVNWTWKFPRCSRAWPVLAARVYEAKLESSNHANPFVGRLLPNSHQTSSGEHKKKFWETADFFLSLLYFFLDSRSGAQYELKIAGRRDARRSACFFLECLRYSLVLMAFCSIPSDSFWLVSSNNTISWSVLAYFQQTFGNRETGGLRRALSGVIKDFISLQKYCFWKCLDS